MATANKSFSSIRNEAIKTCRELCYPKEVQLAIAEADSELKITNIMHDARNGIFPKWETLEDGSVDGVMVLKKLSPTVADKLDRRSTPRRRRIQKCCPGDVFKTPTGNFLTVISLKKDIASWVDIKGNVGTSSVSVLKEMYVKLRKKNKSVVTVLKRMEDIVNGKDDNKRV